MGEKEEEEQDSVARRNFRGCLGILLREYPLCDSHITESESVQEEICPPFVVSYRDTYTSNKHLEKIGGLVGGRRENKGGRNGLCTLLG